MKKKILIVFGTRPEAIKMSPLVLEFNKHQNLFRTEVCVTGQHKSMLDQVTRFFGIEPDYDLAIMRKGQDLYDVTSRVLLGIRKVLVDCQPDLVIVHGDTTTSSIASLASFYQKIPVAHVEAGLRTHDIYSPWPEEINRQITGVIAKYHFAPTQLSKANLIKENKDEKDIIITGNTVIDALLLTTQKIKNESTILQQIKRNLTFEIFHLAMNEPFILVTGHRRENFGDAFLSICEALKSLALSNPHHYFIYPVHLNPNVQNPVRGILSGISNIRLIEPQDYVDFIFLMSKCLFVITDSGGVQEEAPSLGKPVLVMRDTTERPEAIKAGTVKLVGSKKETIIRETQRLIDDNHLYLEMSESHNPYGDGLSSQRIVNYLINKYFS